MKKILLHFGIIAIIFFTACGENASEDTPTITLPVASNATDSAKPTVTTNQLSLPSMPQPYRASNTTTALNPAHGQPGHRCDIAVGAPLNSPTQQIQQPMPATQMIPATPMPATNANGTVRFNPAHGQPGHDCSIAVGQPLK